MSFFRSQFVLVFLALMLLRIVIGAHFFHEGIDKVKSRSFDCEPFLSQARGPLAPLFHGIIDDQTGHLRLCLVPLDDEEESPRFQIDTTLTFAVWEDFVETATQDSADSNTSDSKLEPILDSAKTQLQDFFAVHEEDVIAWANSADRLHGFDRDGDRREKVAQGVESLNEQIASIQIERTNTARAWLTEVEGIWDDLELRVVDAVGARPSQLKLDRPFQPEFSMQSLINKYLPWFDVIVGGLLIIGLFSRLASFGGLMLLFGVVATQPPWVLGSADTFPQWLEIAGLTVVFATIAGRCGGLDYFLMRRSNEPDDEEVEN